MANDWTTGEALPLNRLKDSFFFCYSGTVQQVVLSTVDNSYLQFITKTFRGADRNFAPPKKKVAISFAHDSTYMTIHLVFLKNRHHILLTFQYYTLLIESRCFLNILVSYSVLNVLCRKPSCRTAGFCAMSHYAKAIGIITDFDGKSLDDWSSTLYSMSEMTLLGCNDSKLTRFSRNRAFISCYVISIL